MGRSRKDALTMNGLTEDKSGFFAEFQAVSDNPCRADTLYNKWLKPVRQAPAGKLPVTFTELNALIEIDYVNQKQKRTIILTLGALAALGPFSIDMYLP